MGRGLSGIIYGKEGLGKTSLALRFPGPVYCKSMFENGYVYLEDVGDVPENSINSDIRDYKTLVKEVKETKSGTIVFDSLKGFQAILFEYVCQTYYEGSWINFNSYSSGARKESVSVFQNFLDLCSQKTTEGVNILFLGHMGTTTVSNAMGPDVLCHVISMEDGDKGGIRSTLTAWSGFTFFLNMQVEITRNVEVTRDKKVLEGKADTGDSRVIYTTASLSHQAKNRWNMPNQIRMGKNADEAWANLSKHIPSVYLKKQ